MEVNGNIKSRLTINLLPITKSDKCKILSYYQTIRTNKNTKLHRRKPVYKCVKESQPTILILRKTTTFCNDTIPNDST